MSGSGGSGPGAGTTDKPDKDSLWYFTAEQLASSPSRRHGIDSDQELSYRQMTAYLIQEMGQRLQVSQLCINTAIVYMHRFYAFHSFTHFHRNGIAAASLFLAAKVEEQPRKLEHVIKAANKCLNQPPTSTTDTYYIEQAQDLVFNENVLLQTLGFDVAIDHPHTHVVKTCHLVKACKDLAQTSYFLASNSLHLTSMCLQYKPTVVACFCIYLACKWSRWEIPQSTEGKHWFHYVDKTVTMDLLKQLTDEFIAIYEKSPARLKSKLNSIKALAQGASSRVINKDKKVAQEEWKMMDMMKMYHSSINTSDTNSNSAQSGSSFTNLMPTEQQQQPQQQPQTVQPIVHLPPPPQPQPQSQQQQQMRKSDLHSSQHRTHHNSSSHHHSKVSGFHPSDVPDHKSSHKQQSFAGGLVIRSQTAPSGHQSSMSSSSSSTNPRSNISSSSIGRSSSSSLVAQTAQRQSSSSSSAQGHQLDVNYHKSRERVNLSVSSASATHGMQQPHTSHKISQKQDSNRVIAKDPTGRISTAEQAKQMGNKLFPPSSSSSTSSSVLGMAQYGNSSQMQSGSQVNTKLDPVLEMQRNLIHNQRAYGSNNNGQPGIPPPPPLNYHQTQLSRQSGSSSGGNSKHDQLKPISVHMQQQQQQQQQHKQMTLPPPDSSYALGSHESQQQQQMQQHSHQLSSHAYLSALRPPDMLHADEHLNSHFSASGQLSLPQNQTQTQLKAPSSMFSPDWNEKMQNPLASGSSHNGSNTSNALTNDAYNFKTSSSTKESPKKVERDRSIDAIQTKKEKSKSSHANMESSSVMGMRQSSGQHQVKQAMLQKKLEPHSNTSDIGNSSNTSIPAGLKRSNETIVFKQEDDTLRENKIRKLDNLSSHVGGDMNKLHVVNGIETNPDMVRSLLKESLCTSSALIKTESLTATSLYPPAELLEPTPVAGTYNKISSEGGGNGNGGIEQASAANTEPSGSKSEKKKKKEKHKHKEKDKSKDREERKKHKKDKDRHKDRESDNAEHVKIKISKEKLEAASGSVEQMGFKIKIPKDRIINNDINTSGGSGNALGGIVGNAAMSGTHPKLISTPALKIKISKDKLENYSSGSSDIITVPMPSAAQSSSGFYSSSYGSQNSGTSSVGTSHVSKKKDRDRDKEREKEKKRSNHEFMKSNGSISLVAGVSGSSASTSSASTHNVAAAASKSSQNSSKIQHFNQLFGDFNEDDDHDVDDDGEDYDDNNGSGNNYQHSSTKTSSTLSSSSSQANYRQNADNAGSRNTQTHFNQHHYHHQSQQQR